MNASLSTLYQVSSTHHQVLEVLKVQPLNNTGLGD